MVGLYRDAIEEPTGLELKSGIILFLFLMAISIPLAVAYGVYDYRFALAVFIALAGIIGLILFYNVRTFSMVILPLYYLVIIDHVYFALIILLVIAFLAERTNRANFSLEVPHPLLLFILLVAGANGVVRAVDRDMGRYEFEFAYILPIIAFIIFYNLRPTNMGMKIYLSIITAATALIGWISLALWIQTGIPRQVFRWDSQNTAGCFMGMVLPFALLALLDAKSKGSRIMWLVIFWGVFAGILVTQTRAVLVSLFIAIVYISFKDRRILKVILPALLVVGIALPSLIIYRLALLLGLGDTPDWSSVGRVEIWLNSIQYIPKYFLLGMGMDSFRILYSIDFPYSFVSAIHAHNQYLRWLFDIGIFGLAAFLAIIFKTMSKAMRAVKEYLAPEVVEDRRLLLAINGGLISGLAASMVDATLVQTPSALFLWSMLAFQLVTVARMKETVHSISSEIKSPAFQAR